ncbi:MAG: DUF349 domain-containing protein [Prevotella sp.]|nr:DUF349 domain-containing protein [Prevotella sp.]
MMDSQEKALGQGQVEEEQTTVQAAAEVDKAQEVQADAPVSEEPVQNENSETEVTTAEEPDRKTYTSKKEVLERIREIAHNDENPEKDEVEYLKSTFYRLHIAEREEQQKAYLEEGGDPEKYQVRPDDVEEAFKAEMQVIKEKRAKLFQKQEEERANNLKHREEIIEKIKNMATSPEEANKSFNAFKQLQQEWKEIGAVPPEKANETWKTYQLYVEQFYDLLNLNREAREYDFKKNLEQKTRLCEEAEKLAEETDIISAFHQLQELHAQYRETGPVAKDLRDEIWTRFKNASTVINKKHQQHFEELRAREEENLTKKTALCEKVEAIAEEENKGTADWEKHSQEIIAIQQEWKTIGFAPQKMNVKIFERFRTACDDFFGRKAEYFKEIKKRFAENAEKKRVLVEKAKALADSTDWKSTSDKIIALQKEWKTIGTVPKKLGDRLWNDFLAACNQFFEARNAANAGSRNEEHANLDKKRDIIAKLKAMIEDAGDDVQAKVQALIDEYNTVGHVPYKDKDKVYKEYHEVLDKVYDTLHIKQTRRRLDNFKNNLRNVAKRGEDAVDNERARLMRRYEQLKQEVTTYENNLGFLNIASKKGNSLVEEMNRKVQKLKDEVQLVFDKIKAIDQQAREEAKSDDKNTEK